MERQRRERERGATRWREEKQISRQASRKGCGKAARAENQGETQGDRKRLAVRHQKWGKRNCKRSEGGRETGEKEPLEAVMQVRGEKKGWWSERARWW